MNIDNSRYTTAVGSFEKYRLTYELGLVPAQENENLATGLWMHEFMSWDFKGVTDKAEATRLVLEKGELTDKYAEAGYGYYLVLKEHMEERGYERIASEMEYKVPLEHGHFFLGRFDEVSKFGIVVVDEFKTWSARRAEWEWAKEWKCSPQATGLLIGSRALGHDTQYIDVHIVIKDTPARVKTYKVERTQYDIDYHMQTLAQYCDIIEMLREKWGIERPWPHQIPSIWYSDLRGSCNNDWCEYKAICGLRHVKGVIPEGFKQRKEHLEVLRDDERCKEVQDAIANAVGTEK